MSGLGALTGHGNQTRPLGHRAGIARFLACAGLRCFAGTVPGARSIPAMLALFTILAAVSRQPVRMLPSRMEVCRHKAYFFQQPPCYERFLATAMNLVDGVRGLLWIALIMQESDQAVSLPIQQACGCTDGVNAPQAEANEATSSQFQAYLDLLVSASNAVR